MATIKDLAKAAGVSITTVSRALNGHEDVKPVTKEKILRLAAEMSYRPNAIARSLVMRKTRTIAVIFSEMKRTGARYSFAFETLCGVNDRAAELGYEILLLSTNPNKQVTKSYSDLCMERNVDGAIIHGLRLSDPYLQEIINQTVFPCVLIDIPVKSNRVGYVTTDNVDGARKAVNHLLDLGHTRIAMINGHDDAAVSKLRRQGYKQALEAKGIPFRPELVFNGWFEEQRASEAMYQILLKHPNVSAIFCSSDLMLLGAVRTMRQMGRSVPEDLSAVGYDDIAISEFCSPKLTTIRQDQYEIGYRSAQMLVDILEGRSVERQVVLQNELIIRDSTKHYNAIK